MSRMRSLPLTHTLPLASLCHLLDSRMVDALLQHYREEGSEAGKGRSQVDACCPSRGLGLVHDRMAARQICKWFELTGKLNSQSKRHLC